MLVFCVIRMLPQEGSRCVNTCLRVLNSKLKAKLKQCCWRIPDVSDGEPRRGGQKQRGQCSAARSPHNPAAPGRRGPSRSAGVPGARVCTRRGWRLRRPSALPLKGGGPYHRSARGGVPASSGTSRGAEDRALRPRSASGLRAGSRRRAAGTRPVVFSDPTVPRGGGQRRSPGSGEVRLARRPPVPGCPSGSARAEAPGGGGGAEDAEPRTQRPGAERPRGWGVRWAASPTAAVDAEHGAGGGPRGARALMDSGRRAV